MDTQIIWQQKEAVQMSTLKFQLYHTNPASYPCSNSSRDLRITLKGVVFIELWKTIVL